MEQYPAWKAHSQLVRKFPAFYGTQRFCCHCCWSLSWADFKNVKEKFTPMCPVDGKKSYWQRINFHDSRLWLYIHEPHSLNCTYREILYEETLMYFYFSNFTGKKWESCREECRNHLLVTGYLRVSLFQILSV